LSGVTVPLTVTRSADVELPSAGASTWTCTDVLEEPHPEIASVTRTPVAIHATAAALVGDSPFMPPFSARQPPNLKSAGQTMRRIGRWGTRRPWRAIATWLAFVAVALGALALTDGTKRPGRYALTFPERASIETLRGDQSRPGSLARPRRLCATASHGSSRVGSTASADPGRTRGACDRTAQQTMRPGGTSDT
jgi:hypothetical protein